MTVKAYLKALGGQCYRNNDFTKEPIRFVVTWRVTKALALKYGREPSRKQVCQGYAKRSSALFAAIQLQNKYGINARVVEVK